jgi:hypothetical protein
MKQPKEKANELVKKYYNYVSGFNIRIYWLEFYKPIEFRHGRNNILWLHWGIEKIYFHKTGKIIYKP